MMTAEKGPVWPLPYVSPGHPPKPILNIHAYPNKYTGDVFDEKTWAKELEGASGVVSCIGAFGSNAFMERINGDANVHAAEVARRAGA